jgi:hypothetical protein
MSARALAALLLLVSLPALAAGWEDSFPPEATGSYLESAQQGVLVAAAGEPAAETRAAAAALEVALRDSGRARLVMNDAPLGSLATDSDADVVRKAAALPVDTVAVVRVFAGAPGTPPTAVVTFYDKAGKVLSAFSAQQGQAVPERVWGGLVGRALPNTAQSTVDSVTRVAQDAQAQYEKKYVWFEDAAYVNAYGGVVSHFSVAYQGKSRVPLSGEAFYLAIDRTDLADRYRARRGTRLGLMLGGGAVSVGGMVMALSGVGTRCVRMDAREFGGCLQRENEELLIPGIVVGSAGVVAMLVGALVPHHPVDALEARRLAEEYNEKLKGELGLAAAPAPARAREPKVEVSVGGALLRGGGALVVGVRL